MCFVTRLGQEHQLELFHLYQVVLTLGTGNMLMRFYESMPMRLVSTPTILSMPHATHLVQWRADVCHENDVNARACA